MKRKYIVLILVIILSFGIAMEIHFRVVHSAKVIDQSSVKLPEYHLPKGYITKQQAIKIAMKVAESNLHHKQVPKNPQCVLLPRGIGENLLYGEENILSYKKFKKGFKKGKENFIIPSESDYEARLNELMYFVIIDVNRYPDEVFMRLPPSWHSPKLIDGKWVTTQDTYEIDAATGKIVGHGYYSTVRHIYPKQ